MHPHDGLAGNWHQFDEAFVQSPLQSSTGSQPGNLRLHDVVFGDEFVEFLFQPFALHPAYMQLVLKVDVAQSCHAEEGGDDESSEKRRKMKPVGVAPGIRVHKMDKSNGLDEQVSGVRKSVGPERITLWADVVSPARAT